MRLVNREAFLKLPKGTLFQKYESISLGPLCIKQDNSGSTDFREVDLQNVSFTGVSGDWGCVKAFDDMEAGGQRHVQFTCGRDGEFVDEQLFAIWEEFDLRALQACLAEVVVRPSA